ncbi:MAG: hypothetical protein IKY94_05480 [Lachnospiraceae bacterium]|nr:hypothetical protein [Lachnospiraceae bacterium]
MNREHYIRVLNNYKEKIKNDGSIDPAEIAINTNLNASDLISLLFSVFAILTDEVARLRKENASLKDRIQVSDKALKEAYENPNKRQNALVKNGLKVKKEKLTVEELQLYIELKYTDNEIMKLNDISRATLWRKKNELEKYIAEQEAKKQTRR